MTVFQLSDLDLLLWILTMTFLLIVSSMVIIGKYLASTIHLLKVSHILLSTKSQLEPNLNNALL
jgi:high-affinity K+ transport system ATPase subunit B